jgi:hypothetical protein
MRVRYAGGAPDAAQPAKAPSQMAARRAAKSAAASARVAESAPRRSDAPASEKNARLTRGSAACSVSAKSSRAPSCLHAHALAYSRGVAAYMHAHAPVCECGAAACMHAHAPVFARGAAACMHAHALACERSAAACMHAQASRPQTRASPCACVCARCACLRSRTSRLRRAPRLHALDGCTRVLGVRQVVRMACAGDRRAAEGWRRGWGGRTGG